MYCPVCGEEDCGQHDSVLAFAHLVDLCTFVGLALLSGLIAVAMAVAKV
jgi:hypothetical protein